MDEAVTTPTVLELAPTLEPTTRDDFADEPAAHRQPQTLAPLTDKAPDHGKRQQ